MAKASKAARCGCRKGSVKKGKRCVSRKTGRPTKAKHCRK